MNALMLDIPDEIRTQRLHLRVPRFGDGAIAFQAARLSITELKKWMPWASDDYGEKDAEEWCRRAAAKFLMREELAFLLFHSGEHIGNASLHAFNWTVPKCEVGYWLSTPRCGQGFMTEAVNALTALAFDTLKMQRVEIRCDEQNDRSARVAERTGFRLDAILQRECRTKDDSVRNTCIYSKLSAGQ